MKNLKMWYSLKLYILLMISSIRSEKILIIGAGAAGIATASKLLSHNFTDFRILEAENRIGGRIFSMKIGNAYADLGAMYVQGKEGNVVYDLMKNLFEKDIAKHNEIPNIYYGGKKKTGDNLFRTFAKILWKILAKSHKYAYSSFGNVFTINYVTEMISRFLTDVDMMNYAKNFLRTCEYTSILYEGSSNWKKMRTFSNHVRDGKEAFLVWQGLGYKTIFDILLRNFSGYNINDHISFNKTVSKIILENGKINVKCKDGSEYTSDHVVFTPSLGVLKHDHQNIFQPSLSKDKVDVIESLGFDGILKVIFEFPDEWWGKEEDFRFVWNEEENTKVLKNIPFGPISDDGNHWLSYFFSLETNPKNFGVLIGFIAGPLVPQIEKLTQDEMRIGLMYAIRRFLGNNFNISEPNRIIHSNWFENPHFRGAYSYEPLEIDYMGIESPQNVLLEPIKDDEGIPRILFAGEATSPTRFSVVDGAVGTGFREADRLNEILKWN